MQTKLKSYLGKDFNVLNEDQQHAIILRTVKIEKLFVFITFIFIIGVSSINIFFALSMLAIDKKKDIGMLFAMGANQQQVRQVFISEGAIISLSGAVFGLVAGLLLVLLQQHVGLVKMGLQTSVINYYPVELQLGDFLFTAISIVAITVLVSIRPAVMASRFTEVAHS